MLDFSRFEYLSFDCYGTLIDWERGILGALRPILAAHSRTMSPIALHDEALLELYGDLEASAEQGEFYCYREVLEQVVQGMGRRLGFSPSQAEIQSLPASLPDWQPFPDAVTALRQLKTRYKLAVISNTDDDLFAGTARHLGVAFDHVITAQQARSYKPSQNNFRLALKRLAVSQDKLLHVAQSLYHDIKPCRELSISSVWINRRAGKQSAGATKPAVAMPDLEMPDLQSFAALAMRS